MKRVLTIGHFEDGLEALLEFAGKYAVAVMCAESSGRTATGS